MENVRWYYLNIFKQIKLKMTLQIIRNKIKIKILQLKKA